MLAFKDTVFGEKNSIQFKGGIHFKSRNGHFKMALVVYIFHDITAIHFAHIGGKITAADILVGFTGIDAGLNTHHSFAFHFFSASVAIPDMPLPVQEFYGKIVVILDGDPVGKHIFPIQRVAVVGLIESFNTYADAGRNTRYHTWIINNAPLSGWLM